MSDELCQKLSHLEGMINELRSELRKLTDQARHTTENVRLFVGAKCVKRNGDTVEIEMYDDTWTYGGVTYPFVSSDGNRYLENGRFIDGREDNLDIVGITNPEDYKPPVEYREVNFTDIGKEVYWTHDKTTAGVLGGFGAFSNGSPAAFVFDEDGSAHETTPTSLVIKKSSDDKVVREVWVNCYNNGAPGVTHFSRDEADRCANSNRTSCVRIQYYEGQVDA